MEQMKNAMYKRKTTIAFVILFSFFLLLFLQVCLQFSNAVVTEKTVESNVSDQMHQLVTEDIARVKVLEVLPVKDHTVTYGIYGIVASLWMNVTLHLFLFWIWAYLKINSMQVRKIDSLVLLCIRKDE